MTVHAALLEAGWKLAAHLRYTTGGCVDRGIESELDARTEFAEIELVAVREVVRLSVVAGVRHG